MAQKQDQKLQRFIGSIMAEGNSEAQAILSELEARAAAELAEYQTLLDAELRQYNERRSAEIRAKEQNRVASNAAENKRQLLQFREDCAQSVFDEVTDRIAAFTASEAYSEHLGKLLRKAVAQLGYGFAAEVHLRPEDMKYADYLLTQVSGVSLGFREGSIEVGGLRLVCPARARRIDLSFDSALADLVGHFSELSGMQVREE